MSPSDRKYTTEHEWWQEEGDEGRMGITEFAQGELGDIVFVELPEVGRVLRAGEALGVVESVKSVSDILSPVAGEVVAVNEALRDQPELINRSPYADGWIVRLRKKPETDTHGLMDAAAYEAYVNAH